MKIFTLTSNITHKVSEQGAIVKDLCEFPRDLKNLQRFSFRLRENQNFTPPVANAEKFLLHRNRRHCPFNFFFTQVAISTII